MSDRNRRVYDWQRRFRQQPRVWCVVDPDGVLEDVYADEASARLAIEWGVRHGLGRSRCFALHVHSPELARERWVDEFRTIDEATP